MIKIYKVAGSIVSEAWIGGSAPIPVGWFLDVNSAMKDGEKPESSPPMEAPKKRGRPRKAVS